MNTAQGAAGQGQKGSSGAPPVGSLVRLLLRSAVEEDGDPQGAAVDA